jgi:hypothetical protein
VPDQSNSDGNGKPIWQEPPPLRQAHHVPHLDAKKSFTATAQADRLKEYIKDIPVLRARIVQAVTHLEALVAAQQAELGLARTARQSFEEAAEEITARFKDWENKSHGTERAHSEPGTPGTGEPVPGCQTPAVGTGGCTR